MHEQIKRKWLIRVLFVKVMVTWFMWGLPALLGNAWFLSLFGLRMPENPVYLRLFGAAVTAFGSAYYLAFRDPVQNRAIVVAGIVDNALITLTILMLAWTQGLESWFMGFSAVLTALFCIAFIVLCPASTAHAST